MSTRPAVPENALDTQTEVAGMWGKGVAKIAAILPIDIWPAQPGSFEHSTAGGDFLDISSISPAELPQVELLPERKNGGSWLGFVRNMIPGSTPATQPSKQYLSDASRIAESLVEQEPEITLGRLEATFDVVEESLLDTVTDRDYVFTKINHRCWEEITNIGLRAAGKEYIRKMGAIDQGCIDSGFYECLAVCMNGISQTLSDTPGQSREIQLRGKDFSFGIALTGGNSTFVDDFKGQGRDARVIRNIYPSVTIGSASGLLGFFASLAEGDRRWVVADGSAPKALFWNGQFGRFIENIVNASDAILFIVPPWLSGVTLAQADGVSVFKLIVPGDQIDTMWSLVAPVVLQYIAELSGNYRLTVLSQCSALSAIIGMMTSLHLRGSKHRSPFRFYDLGQLLDLANIGKADAGYWLTRSDVKTHADETNDWSKLLWNS